MISLDVFIHPLGTGGDSLTTKNHHIMDNKLIKSQINLISAQLNQLSESELFSESEIERLSVSYREKLSKLEEELAEAEGQSLKNIDVVSPENISE